MATLSVNATGNFTAAGTWQVANTTSLSLTGTTEYVVPTSAGATSDSAVFQPGAITVDGIGLNLSRRAGTTGTMTVTLRNSTLSSDVISVTINTADLPAETSATTLPNVDGSWHYFKFAAPQLLLVATNYLVRVVTSSSAQVYLRGLATNNWNRFLATTTTGAPATTDATFIGQAYTGAGTSTPYTVTMDNNNTTSFGNMIISNGGTLTWSVAANTQLRLAGNLICWQGSATNQGTSGSPVPVGTTSILEFDCGSNVQYGFINQWNAITNIYGGNKTYFKSYLAANASAGATSLTLADSVGADWKNTDVCCLASTTRTYSQAESKALTADGSGTTLTITALTNAHSGTAPTRAEIGNLTRNIKIRAVSSFTTYLYFSTLTTSVLRWAEIYTIGSATANKTGIVIQCNASGSLDIQYCSVYNATVASSYAIYAASNSYNNITISNNIVYNVTVALYMAPTTGTSWIVNNNLFMLSTNGTIPLALINDELGTYTNNTHTCSFAAGIIFGDSAGVGTINNIISHSNSSYGCSWTTFIGQGTITNVTSYFNNSHGIYLAAANIAFGTTGYFILDQLTCFGNVTTNVNLAYCIVPLLGTNWVLDSDSTYNTIYGIYCGANTEMHRCILQNCTLGATTAHTTSDLYFPTGSSSIYLQNCLLNSSTEMTWGTSSSFAAFITSSKHGRVANNYKAWFIAGSVERDTVVFHNVSPSEKLTPRSASIKLESSIKTYALLNDQKATVSAWVRKGTSYNGNNQNLIVKQNISGGITSDTILATSTASIGNWDLIQGTTIAVTENCILEFVVNCDGTAGTVNVSDWVVKDAQADTNDTGTSMFDNKGMAQGQLIAAKNFQKFNNGVPRP